MKLIILLLVFLGIVAYARGYLHKQQNDTAPLTLTHAALGSTKAFYTQYNEWFIKRWQEQTGQTLTINMVYDVSGELTRHLAQGTVTSDLITLSNPAEMDKLADAKIVAPDWSTQFDYHSSPFYSVVSFLVRAGNPHHITDWPDLIKPGIKLITSDPVSCGGGRWVYAAAKNYGESHGIPDYVESFYAHVPQTYANQSVGGNAFVADHVGDALITYENYSLSEIQSGKTNVKLVTPPSSLAINFPIAINPHNTSRAARAYFAGLYTQEAQSMAAQHYLRPRIQVDPALLTIFPKLDIVSSDHILKDGDITYHDR